jgi:hypothetical protein
MIRPIPLVTALCLGLAINACETPRQHKAAEDAAIKKQAADEIARICALHGAEREAELQKLKDASGMELYCADK